MTHPSPPIDDPAPPSDDLAAPAALLRVAWRNSETGTEVGNDLVSELLGDGGSPVLGDGSAALAPEEAVCQAVLGEHDAAVFADATFAAWFPDPRALPELGRLLARARAGRPSLGLLETADGAVVAAWAGAGPEAQKMARDPQTRSALSGRRRVLVVVFAPSRSSDLAGRAMEAFGLSPLESRLAEAFLFAPTLEIAAAQVGIGRATARDALERIMAKTGARRSAEIVGRLAELMSAVRERPEPSASMLAEAFGLTRAEAGVALQIAGGATHREAAEVLGLKVETVRSYAKAALAKAGVSRAKDLARLVVETQALSRLVAVAEPVFTTGAPPARLRLLPRSQGRRLAFLDYGPRSGRPAFISHGFVAGRSLPPPLARGLQSRGLRPLVLQRPGFGLTSPAPDEAYTAAASEDLAALIEALGLDEIVLFARDGGVAAALDFAARHPQRIARGVLLNPRPPTGLPAGYLGKPVSTMTRLILSQPQVIGGLGEFIRRRTRSDYLEAALRQTLSAIPEDRAVLEDPAVRGQLIRDIQAQFAHTSAGYAAEHGLYARGWQVPPVAGGRWTIVHSGALGVEPARTPWLDLPSVDFRTLPDAGVLVQFSHADALAEMLAELA